MSAFKQVIHDEAELREILGYAGRAASNKVIPEIDEICRAFIAKSPFVLLGSTDADGSMDVSPKGDPAGFVQVMDSKTLLIPDRPGNRSRRYPVEHPAKSQYRAAVSCAGSRGYSACQRYGSDCARC